MLICEICEECKDCENYQVCEVGCFGSDKPCENLRRIDHTKDDEPKPNYWGEY